MRRTPASPRVLAIGITDSINAFLADHVIACGALLIQRMMPEKSQRRCACAGGVAGCLLKGSRGHYNGRGESCGKLR